MINLYLLNSNIEEFNYNFEEFGEPDLFYRSIDLNFDNISDSKT